MRVTIVGAHGQVGPALVDHLGDDPAYEFTCVDVVDHPERDTVVADATSSDELRPAFEGRDAVVHLARVNRDGDRDLDAQFENLRMHHAVLEAARNVGVETVVFASTSHVVGTVEEANAPELYYPGHGITIDHETPVCPDSLYGVEKAYGEALGRYYVEHEPAPEQFFALRIGTIRPPPRDHPYCMAEEGVDRGDWERGSEAYEEMAARVKATWQSRRDVAHMVDRCLRTSGAGFEILYGVSDNDRRWFDLSRAREVIGYDPQDDGEEWDGPPSG